MINSVNYQWILLKLSMSNHFISKKVFWFFELYENMKNLFYFFIYLYSRGGHLRFMSAILDLLADQNFLKLLFYENLYQMACSYPCLKYIIMLDKWSYKLKSMNMWKRLYKPKSGMNWILLYNTKCLYVDWIFMI